MPKNKFQDVVFTAIMATVMVYGMVVYNVALNMGKVTGETFLAAVHELPDHGAGRIYLRIFYCRKDCESTCFYGCDTGRQTADHHLRDLYLHLLYHVSAHEPCGNFVV